MALAPCLHVSCSSSLRSGVVCDLDETSALMWPACGSCGSPVVTEEGNLHHCPRCSKVSQELIVHMSLVVFVKVANFPSDTSIRVKVNFQRQSL